MTRLSKTCFKCGIEKPITEFHKNAKVRDGRVNKCKPCQHEYQRRRLRGLCPEPDIAALMQGWGR